jgi:hypothetical protein
MEDVGLNINERNNKVSFSHYVVLNLPNIKLQKGSDMDEVKSNLIRLWKVMPSTDPYLSPDIDVNKWFPSALQNYMMNFETNIRNQQSYDFSSSKTVTERIFWKFMQKLGAIHFQKDDNGYYHEPNTSEEISKHIIKGFGYITSSSQSSKSHVIDNETYIMIPSSYGQMKYILREVEDNNYIIKSEYTSTNPESKRKFLEGHQDDYEGQSPLDVYQTPFFDNTVESKYIVTKQDNIDNGYQTGDDVNDALEIDFDLTDIKKALSIDSDITYDDLAIKQEYRLCDNYDFNAILIYYTISDSVGNNIATNLYGIIILDSAQYNGKTIVSDIGADVAGTAPMTINSYKKTSSTEKTFGSSYSIRLDIQTASIYDNTAHIITDISTAESSTLTDFNEVVSNLNDCVKIMKNNAIAVANMNTVIQNVKQQTADTSDAVKRVEQSVNDILHGNIRDISANDVDAISMHVSEIIPKSLDDDGNIVEITKIYGNDGDEYGEFDSSVFRYKNIQAENINTSVASALTIGIPVEGVTFDSLNDGNISGNEIGSISTDGNTFFEDSLPNYHCNENGDDISSEDAVQMETIWNELNIKKDGDGYLTINIDDQNIKKYVNIPKIGESEQLRGNISTKNLISLLIWKIKQLEG